MTKATVTVPLAFAQVVCAEINEADTWVVEVKAPDDKKVVIGCDDQLHAKGIAYALNSCGWIGIEEDE